MVQRASGILSPRTEENLEIQYFPVRGIRVNVSANGVMICDFRRDSVQKMYWFWNILAGEHREIIYV